MISTREGLSDALEEAAELEHGLMLQYLFAGVSLKKRLDEGLTGAQQETIRDWEGRVFGVMREEMAHLGTVCNLLSAIGGAPRFGRPNFPQAAKDYYPFAFLLAPFSEETIYRFIRFELPKGETPPDPPATSNNFLADAVMASLAPEPVEYEYIGELYRQIKDAFNTIPEGQLFIGPRFVQDTEDWSRRMRILRVIDRPTANAAIDFIIEQGEGSPGNRKDSHYAIFLKIREEIRAAPGLNPARPIVLNPRTRPHRDAPGPATLLTNVNAVRVAELFNACYETALLMLAQLYSFGGETLGERSALRDGARQFMTMALRPIAELLTEMPATDNPAEGNAGPTFELYAPLQLSTQRPNRWTILHERMKDTASEAKALAGLNARFAFISENIALIDTNLQLAQAREERL